MSDEPRKSGTPNKQGLYAKAAVYAEDAIKVLAHEMEHGDNSNSRVGAAKALLAKVIPDLKAMEITGEKGDMIRIILDTNVARNLVQPTSEVSNETA